MRKEIKALKHVNNDNDYPDRDDHTVSSRSVSTDAGDQFGGKNSKKSKRRKGNIMQVTTGERRECSTTISSIRSKGETPTFGRCELDSHADTIVAGANCIIMHYTGNICDVSPYRDDYEAAKGIPIVTAATAW